MEEYVINEMLIEAYYKGFREGFSKGFEDGYKNNLKISKINLFVGNLENSAKPSKIPSEENEMVSTKRTKSTKSKND